MRIVPRKENDSQIDMRNDFRWSKPLFNNKGKRVGRTVKRKDGTIEQWMIKEDK